MSISAELGSVRQVQLSGGNIRYRETGSGPPVVFVHGVLTNGDFWRAVAPAIAAAGYRCVTPDWPAGSHQIPVPGIDLSPPGYSAMIGEFLETLGMTEVTLVGNDSGGAMIQVLMTTQPSRIGRVVLTPCDSFENFLPPLFSYLPVAARIPPLTRILLAALRLRAVQRLPIALGWLTMRPLPPAIAHSYLQPALHSPEIRADLCRYLRGAHRRHTLAAAARFPSFGKPVLMCWPRGDRVFRFSNAERLQRALPNAVLREITNSYGFVPEDQPSQLVTHILEFLQAPASQPG